MKVVFKKKLQDTIVIGIVILFFQRLQVLVILTGALNVQFPQKKSLANKG